MKCTEAKDLFSLYLDGCLGGLQMQPMAQHLESCEGCRREYGLLRQTQQMVATLGRKHPPADLSLRLRVAISQEAAVVRGQAFEDLRVRFSNALNAFMVPATAGVLSAVVIFGLLIGFLAIPAEVQASGNDVPTMLYTPPQLAASPFSEGFSANGDVIVLEAYVDANGRVQDYRILSGPEDARAMLPQLENMLIFTVFRPAMAFGRPTSGRAVLSFSKISVRG